MSKKIYCDECGTLVCELTKGKWKNNAIAICGECNNPPTPNTHSDESGFEFLKSMMGMK